MPRQDAADVNGETLVNTVDVVAIQRFDNWKMHPDGSSQQREVEATGIPPTNDVESALVQTLPPGNYTAVVRGQNDTTGVGLVEVYNLQ